MDPSSTKSHPNDTKRHDHGAAQPDPGGYTGLDNGKTGEDAGWPVDPESTQIANADAEQEARTRDIGYQIPTGGREPSA